MLAATIDVGDVFPRAQRLNGHKLGGFPMVWFHLGNRMRRRPARGLVSSDKGSGADGDRVADASQHDRDRAQHKSCDRKRPSGLRRYSWTTVTTNPTTPIAKAASNAVPTAVAAPSALQLSGGQ